MWTQPRCFCMLVFKQTFKVLDRKKFSIISVEKSSFSLVYKIHNVTSFLSVTDLIDCLGKTQLRKRVLLSNLLKASRFTLLVCLCIQIFWLLICLKITFLGNVVLCVTLYFVSCLLTAVLSLWERLCSTCSLPINKINK